MTRKKRIKEHMVGTAAREETGNGCLLHQASGGYSSLKTLFFSGESGRHSASVSHTSHFAGIEWFCFRNSTSVHCTQAWKMESRELLMFKFCILKQPNKAQGLLESMGAKKRELTRRSWKRSCISNIKRYKAAMKVYPCLKSCKDWYFWGDSFFLVHQRVVECILNPWGALFAWVTQIWRRWLNKDLIAYWHGKNAFFRVLRWETVLKPTIDV